MKTICIVPCGKAKIWDKYPDAGPTKAKDVYTGPFAKKCRSFAIRFYPESWFILSAKFGFLKPEDIVPGPYNVSFNAPRSNPIGAEELRSQAGRLNFGRYEKAVVLGGKNYVAMMEKIAFGIVIEAPLVGCDGIGHMMKRINAFLRKRDEPRQLE